MVDEVFHRVAPRYDLMNDLMSLGLHRAWKNALVTAVEPAAECTALRAARCRRRHRRCRLPDRQRRGRRRPTSRFATSMPTCWMSAASARHGSGLRSRRDFHGRQCRIAAVRRSQLRCGDHCVRHPQCAADRYGAGRVFSRIQARRPVPLSGIFRTSMCRALTRCMIFTPSTSFPALGRAVAGDGESYRYLVELIRRFPKPQAFADMMHRSGVSPRVLPGHDRRHRRAAFRLAFVISASSAHLRRSASVPARAGWVSSARARAYSALVDPTPLPPPLRTAGVSAD